MTERLENLAVVVPVREGSTRVRDKVLLPFTEEHNLLQWKLTQLLEVLPGENIFVSTDSDRLKAAAREIGVSVHDREEYLCRGHVASFTEVITGIVEDIPHPYIAWVTVVVPLMSPAQYEEGFRLFFDSVVRDRAHDSLVSVNLLKEYFWNDAGPLNYRADRNHTISQDLPNIYRVTNGLYMRDRESILRDGYFLGPNPYRHVVDKIAGVDIDEWVDYQMARALLPVYRQNLAER